MNDDLQYSKTGQALTAQFEGCRLTAYQDVKGVWTIGYGHTLGVYEGETCTQDQALAWLAQDMGWACAVVKRLVQVPLLQGEFDALVDFVFNAGSGNFASSTMLKLLNAGDFGGAAAQFERWDQSGGQVVAGLLRRRQAEEKEFDE
jgi:lysozyme